MDLGFRLSMMAVRSTTQNPVVTRSTKRMRSPSACRSPSHLRNSGSLRVSRSKIDR